MFNLLTTQTKGIYIIWNRWAKHNILASTNLNIYIYVQIISMYVLLHYILILYVSSITQHIIHNQLIGSSTINILWQDTSWNTIPNNNNKVNPICIFTTYQISTLEPTGSTMQACITKMNGSLSVQVEVYQNW